MNICWFLIRVENVSASIKQWIRVAFYWTEQYVQVFFYEEGGVNGWLGARMDCISQFSLTLVAKLPYPAHLRQRRRRRGRKAAANRFCSARNTSVNDAELSTVEKEEREKREEVGGAEAGGGGTRWKKKKQKKASPGWQQGGVWWWLNLFKIKCSVSIFTRFDGRRRGRRDSLRRGTGCSFPCICHCWASGVVLLADTLLLLSDFEGIKWLRIHSWNCWRMLHSLQLTGWKFSYVKWLCGRESIGRNWNQLLSLGMISRFRSMLVFESDYPMIQMLTDRWPN